MYKDEEIADFYWSEVNKKSSPQTQTNVKAFKRSFGMTRDTIQVGSRPTLFDDPSTWSTLKRYGID